MEAIVERTTERLVAKETIARLFVSIDRLLSVSTGIDPVFIPGGT